MKSVYRLSSHAEPERASLPPDYTSTRGDDVTSERVGTNGVGPQKMEVVGGQLPPMYSTSLSATRNAITEHNNASEVEVTILEENDDTVNEEEIHVMPPCLEFHEHSDSRIEEN